LLYVHCASISTVSSVYVLGSGYIHLQHQQCGRAGCIHIYCQQGVRAGCIHLHHQQGVSISTVISADMHVSILDTTRPKMVSAVKANKS
jgi:hypothetical protein